MFHIKKFSLNTVLLIVTIFLLSGCVWDDDTAEKPWQGFSKNKESGKLEWWFVSFQSYEACIESMEWDISNSVHKAWYLPPVGCGFSSNSKIKTIFMNLFVGDMSMFECLVESKNPETRKIKAKYGPVLKGFHEACSDTSKYVVIY
ncbi:hypothetical protein ORI98_05225 [Shewanella sp. ULN5]|uniref:hypothetical protein n=1 Tax=Shewanella sp. ULN5 TaxID=2994678 RepID=UPI00273D15EA|nr:hypothetical protein [Shewanella sp. ULN5]MDP5145842.1 hypothetical protein [Shewanella sp. ULN5]